VGMFDFFKRGGAGKSASGKAELDRPRDQHYAFAHYVLRDLAYKHPLGCVGYLHGPDKDKMLTSLWQEIGDNCKASGPAGGYVGGAPPTVRHAAIGRFPSAIVVMPEPLGPTEAYFVAIVLHVDVTAMQGGQEPPEQPDLSYYTLEKGVTLGGESRTVLCGWNADGAHLNYGDGPPADFDAFVAAVTEHVTGRGGEPVASFNPGSDPQTRPAPRPGPEASGNRGNGNGNGGRHG
jgi:hypothetical protein